MCACAWSLFLALFCYICVCYLYILYKYVKALLLNALDGGEWLAARYLNYIYLTTAIQRHLCGIDFHINIFLVVAEIRAECLYGQPNAHICRAMIIITVCIYVVLRFLCCFSSQVRNFFGLWWFVIVQFSYCTAISHLPLTVRIVPHFVSQHECSVILLRMFLRFPF